MLRAEYLTRLCRARALLGDPLHSDRSIASIAAETAWSPFHFARRFAAVFGETPHRYRTRARLDRARDRLAGGDTVTEACLAVGFTSLGSFSTLFARRFGVSPSAFRRTSRAARSAGQPAPHVAPPCMLLFAAACAASQQFSRSDSCDTER